VDAKGNLPGAKPEDYGLPAGERLNEAITQSWNRMRRHWADFRAAARNLPETEAGTGLTNDKWSVPLLRELGFGLLPTSAGPELAGKTYAINRFFGTTAVHLVGCNLSLDRRAAGVRGATTNPHGLVQEFLNRSGNHLWAIVSNGLRFRVLRDNQALSRQSYLEFDLEAMFNGEVYSDFVLLWLMAHATRFAPQRENQTESCWLEQWTKVAEEDGTRALGDLRAGVEKALQILGEAFVSHPRNTALREALRNEKLSLNDFHGQLLRIVYRLIFLFVAEDRTLDGNSLLHPLDDSESGRQARDHFESNYSTTRLRNLAANIKGSRHGDLWHQFNLLVGALSGDERFDTARKRLALPALGSFLWSPKSTSALNSASLEVGDGVELANADFLEALRHLAFTRQGRVLRPVDYKNLGAEELGGVYETLLALTPQISGDGNRFTFAEFAGNERKTSGSYYTPDSLVQCLLDSALDPVVEEALKGKNGVDAERAILSLKVCDPAVGSGHFLVGAAHRLARHLARVRANTQGESEPSPLLYQHALRDVIGRCLYGVDINPMSAELCRVSLWLEALEPGKPLSFLDHHIQVGNSLLGTTPLLLANGIPDEAFTAIEGDIKEVCSRLKKQNKKEVIEHKSGQHLLFEPPIKLGNLANEYAKLAELTDDTIESVHQKETEFTKLVSSTPYLYSRLLADMWCAVFVWKKDESDIGQLCPTEYHFRRTESNPHSTNIHVRDEVQRLADQYQFFHWHLAFPDVFHLPGKGETPENEQNGWSGGFDVVLGNPPWERVKLQEKEWFAERNPEIANAPNAAARKRLIEALRASEPTVHMQFLEAARQAEGESHLLRNTDRFPLCGRGDINVYAVFAEGMRNIVGQTGRSGCVLPSGIATDDTTKFFFQDVVETRSLISLFDFENKLQIFTGVAPVMKFCLFTTGSPLSSAAESATFVFFAHQIEDLADLGRRFTLTPKDIGLLNPNTRTCPIFRSRRDAELTKAIYRRVPVLIREARNGQLEENPWGIKFSTMFHMSNDSHLFRTREQLDSEGWTLEGNIFCRGNEQCLPLYESKLFHQFNHRPSTFDGIAESDRFKMKAPTIASTSDQLSDPHYATLPRFWVNKSNVDEACRSFSSVQSFVAFRGMTNVMTNSRNAVFAVLPRVAVANSAPICFFLREEQVHSFLGAVDSFAFDYATRQKLAGGNMNFFIVNQLPVLPSSGFLQPCAWAGADSQGATGSPLSAWLLPRVLELTYTAWDLEPFACDCGYDGPPFCWDDDRRFLLRAELDAAFFHLYLPVNANGDWLPANKADGCPHDESSEDLTRLKESFPTPRDAVSYIMDTFPIVRRKDEAAHNGDYRTKRVILEIYEAMQESRRTGQPYQTSLDPPPGPSTDSDGKFIPVAEWDKSNWPSHIHPPRSGKARTGL
jgi:hypothetical protein